MKLNMKNQSSEAENVSVGKDFMKKANDFRLRFPIFFNILLILFAGIILLWVLLFVVDSFTLHGREDVVPDVKGQNFNIAAAVLEKEGLKVELADSIFDMSSVPGTVVDQNPRAGSKVKPGRDVYLTIVAYSPKLVSFPDVVNTSLRQGYSMIEGAGIKQIVIKRVPSEYEDLVLGAFIDGREVKPGTKVPITSMVTIEVGEGIGDGEGEAFTDEYGTEGDV